MGGYLYRTLRPRGSVRRPGTTARALGTPLEASPQLQDALCAAVQGACSILRVPSRRRWVRLVPAIRQVGLRWAVLALRAAPTSTILTPAPQTAWLTWSCSSQLTIMAQRWPLITTRGKKTSCLRKTTETASLTFYPQRCPSKRRECGIQAYRCRACTVADPVQ